MAKKKKKPTWPIVVCALFLVGILAVLLIDWERYPTADEFQRFVEDQHSGAEKVEVTKVEVLEEEYFKGQVYHFKVHYQGNHIENDTTTISEKDRRAVYPWHDYYSGFYRADLEQKN